MNRRNILKFFNKPDGFHYTPRIFINDLGALVLGVATLVVCISMFRLENNILFAITAGLVGIPILTGGVVNVVLGVIQTMRTNSKPRNSGQRQQ